MPRKYTHLLQYEEAILRLKEEGYTHHEIARRLGLEYVQIKNFLYRHEKETVKSVPRRKGRARTKPITDWKTMETELERLRMENELLRDFLSETERM